MILKLKASSDLTSPTRASKASQNKISFTVEKGRPGNNKKKHLLACMVCRLFYTLVF